MKREKEIAPASGKLGVLLPGMGAVATACIAGVELVRRGLGLPIGSTTQLGTIRLGKGETERVVCMRDFVPLASLSDLVFAGWDVFPDDCYIAALKAGVLERVHLDTVKDFLRNIWPMPAVFDSAYVPRLCGGTNLKSEKSKLDLAQSLIEDIERFRNDSRIERAVMIWCGSTEVFMETAEVHQGLQEFEAGLARNEPAIAPSMIYAYAALKCHVPFVNSTPNLCVEIPALVQLAEANGVPIAGKDLKTGQSLVKTVLAPGLKARHLGLKGWFSSNLLGNRDGEILSDPRAFKTKEVTKLSALEQILQPELHPELYSDFHHMVRIHYYPPRGDNKESWDNIDITGWLNYPMQIKINALYRDSILAAPLVLDLALFSDLAHRAEMTGIQDWLSFYFKSPMCVRPTDQENDLFIQLTKMENTLRFLMNEADPDFGSEIEPRPKDR
jgi:myo-inositol-1-phosphate synthase